jgi:hypothetical protein
MEHHSGEMHFYLLCGVLKSSAEQELAQNKRCKYQREREREREREKRADEIKTHK